MQFDLGPGQMQTHFPQGVSVAWSLAGSLWIKVWSQGRTTSKRQRQFTVSQGVIVIKATAVVLRTWAMWCSHPHRTRSISLRMEVCRPREALRFWSVCAGGTTELVDGGSPPEGGLPLHIKPASGVLGVAGVAGFWMAGEVVMPVSDEQRAQSLLLSGVLSDGSYERPMTEGYRAGLADYAGLNLLAWARRAAKPGAVCWRASARLTMI